MEEIAALILAAGRGTRLLPATKSVPKEMLPLVDRPLIHYTLDEAVSSGLDHAIIVTARGKDIIHHYFDADDELERMVGDKAEEYLGPIRRLVEACQLTYVRQLRPAGIADAVRTAQRPLAGRPFVLYFPDDVIISDIPVTRQLLDVHRKYNASVIAVERVARDQVHRYGIVDVEPVEEGIYRIRGLVEKPAPQDAPSDLGIVGRYVITPGIFDAIAATRPGVNNELQITDALANLLKSEPIYACAFSGTRYDTGNPAGYLRTALALALQRHDVGPEIREALRAVLSAS